MAHIRHLAGRMLSRGAYSFRLCLPSQSVGSLVGGQQDMMLLFGTVLGSIFLAATLAFIVFCAPFTLFAALLLAPYVVSMFVPIFSPVFLTRFLCTFVGWVLGSMLRSEWDRHQGRGAPASKFSGQEASDSLEWRVGRKIFREAGFSGAASLRRSGRWTVTGARW